MNNLTVNYFIVSRTTNYPDIIKDVDNWLKVNKDNATGSQYTMYQHLKESLDNYTKAEAEYKKDSYNCELLRDLQMKYWASVSSGSELTPTEIEKLVRKDNQTSDLLLDDEDHLKNMNNHLEILHNDVEEFIRSLNATEREENKNFLEWCNRFTSTKDSEEKYKVFLSVTDFFDEELERETKAGKVNCRLMADIEGRQKFLKIIEEVISKIIKGFFEHLFKVD